jgi:hypothetical protein
MNGMLPTTAIRTGASTFKRKRAATSHAVRIGVMESMTPSASMVSSTRLLNENPPCTATQGVGCAAPIVTGGAKAIIGASKMSTYTERRCNPGLSS